ncbi:MAG: tRNA pseudouridine(38-40) synthase TruA [Verrucomicrobiota bacterium JB022]|nr:tRNA pseudouridine(38-40) synthase TruA [Verrucomicrobiota bacterium JB022]
MRWKCTVAYDGTDFEGWQSQPSQNTIQDHIERRLAFLFKGHLRIHGSGRTDSGVHARGQVFHFDGEWKWEPEDLLKALRVGFPDSIQVYRAERVPDDFHARFSATGKRYIYRMFEGFAGPFDYRWHWSLGNWRLDVDRMNEAAKLLLGEHDFSAFSANPRDGREESTVKDMRRLELVREGPYVTLYTEASGYLFRMVRSLAGCLVHVGIGRLTGDDLREILESATRTERVVTAPAGGLFLDHVYYEGAPSPDPRPGTIALGGGGQGPWK